MSDYNGYSITHMGTFNMYKIKNKGSGPAPKVLSGMYTTRDAAHKAIDGHIAKTKKGSVNGTSKDSSTG